MSIKDLIPKFARKAEDVKGGESGLVPAHEFQRQMNRLFDEFFNGFPPVGSGWDRRGDEDRPFYPKVNIATTDKEITISAELPGMDEKDIAVEMNDQILTIRGERKEENEHKDKNWSLMEQSYGMFQRTIPLPAGVRTDPAKAQFKNGVLTLTFPRKDDPQQARRIIPIKAG